jgi:hypothetical protein
LLPHSKIYPSKPLAIQSGTKFSQTLGEIGGVRRLIGENFCKEKEGSQKPRKTAESGTSPPPTPTTNLTWV